MSERDNLLASIANNISSFRYGEIRQRTPADVNRWVQQFHSPEEIVFLREINSILSRHFLTRTDALELLENRMRFAPLVGNNPAAFWQRAHFLEIQRNGTSQVEMKRLFGQLLQSKFNLDINRCGCPGGHYIYLDDVMFTGKRLATDLRYWMENEAPNNAVVDVVLLVAYSGGKYYLESRRLKSIIEESGKNITVNLWPLFVMENRKWYARESDVFWPSFFESTDLHTAFVQDFGEPALRPNDGSFGNFETFAGRVAVERELLNAGLLIRSRINNPTPILKPLGFGDFGFGFGSTVVTYRNCPNNCPLAFWWGDENAAPGSALDWFPLLPRRNYSSVINPFAHFDD